MYNKLITNISYDDVKDKYYIDYADGAFRTFYGEYAFTEALREYNYNDTEIQNILNKLY